MADCVVCPRPVADTAYGCPLCARRLQDACHDIATAATGARDAVDGQARRSPAVAGSGGSDRLPINPSARLRYDRATNDVITWARHVAETRGATITPPPRPAGPPCAAAARRLDCRHRSCRDLAGERDPLVIASTWLAGQTDWLRHRQEFPDALDQLERAARTLRSLADGPSGRRWLGQCGADTDDDGPCRTDLYARDGADTATCRTCGAKIVVADRRRELGNLVRGYSYTASEIHAAYPDVRADRIRQWASRGRILATGDMDGRPTYDLGEVLDLAAQEVARRATEQAKRARRRDTELQSDRELAS